jgi:hypothetical protein
VSKFFKSVVISSLGLIVSGAVLLNARAATNIEGRIEGQYAVKGVNPNGSQYVGTLEVKRTGAAVRLIWQVGKSKYVGTGLQTDNVLSVAYSVPGAVGCGVVVYRISPNLLNGVWTICGSETVGVETASK